MKQYLMITVTLLVAGFLSSGSVCAAQIDASCVADTRILDDDPNANCGASGGFVMQARTNHSATNDNIRLLYRFDLQLGESGGIPAGATITKAELNAYLSGKFGYQYVYGIGDFHAHELTQQWLEGTGNGGATGDGATWNTYDGASAWPVNGTGGDYDPTPEDTITLSDANYDSYVQWDIQSLVQAWVNGTEDNNGVIIIAAEGVAGVFGMTEDMVAMASFIDIEYTAGGGPVPEPGTMLLLGTGILGLAGVIRRRRMN